MDHIVLVVATRPFSVDLDGSKEVDSPQAPPDHRSRAQEQAGNQEPAHQEARRPWSSRATAPFRAISPLA